MELKRNFASLLIGPSFLQVAPEEEAATEQRLRAMQSTPAQLRHVYARAEKPMSSTKRKATNPAMMIEVPAWGDGPQKRMKMRMIIKIL